MASGDGRAGPRLARVRALCLAFPATEERTSHGEPCWFAGGKKMFVMAARRHHDERVAFWAAAPEGVQGSLVAAEPERYFRPPYVGTRGWVGVYLDIEAVDWDRVAGLVEDAWRQVAPRRLVAEHDAG
ncbi:MmcQ/YjbR family DNA-binding protein [Phycicoccus sp. Soil748]|uniref:MmcQ/YjbR family DNA-binding protein n=1 Tax=Phycicoccus sp. Soil748 TaxID=1736397 RepID=UPI000702B31E|nr:MmcQ/YjbR family DNA-binding protein [Phycicoccus sp. Soil748]KRE57241.1 phosphoribosylglycinamide formyltransferase [Phycicoccus sp. Soil748]